MSTLASYIHAIIPFRILLRYVWLMCIPFAGAAQTIKGKVSNRKNEPLAGASVYWAGSNTGTTTGADGEFEITLSGQTGTKLIAAFSAYVSDTIDVSLTSAVEFKLRKINVLNEVVIKEQRDGVTISSVNPIKTEQITQAELKKAACCDLAGCFETQTTVQPQVTNIITQSKELRILGLSGVYNQVLLDGMPLIQGLTYTYGISSVPGTLVDNIYVSKGANSVVQGYESISGQINVETKEPDKSEKLLLNAYINNFMEKHFNVNYAFRVKKWSSLTAIHSVQPANRVDRDQDNFLDLPLLSRYLVSSKWKYGQDNSWGWSSRIGFRLLHEKRIGGQLQFDADKHKGSTLIYGQSVDITQPELWTKTSYRINDEHTIVFFGSAFQQQQQSYFGSIKYDAFQRNFYSNIQYEFNYSSHLLKTGLSYRYLLLNEQIGFSDTWLNRTYAGTHERLERIPGVFIENTLRLPGDKFTWIAGIRVDHHNQFGIQVTPRTLVKYDITPKTIIRANAGTGWRTVNLFSENIGLLISSRDVIISETLMPEKATNLGINFTQKFDISEPSISGYISADAYRTDFQNQIFPDYDTDSRKAIVKNFTGTSISNGVQFEFYLHYKKQFEWKAGYNYLDVYREINGTKQLLPFNAVHKFITTFGYAPLSKKMRFDMNIHRYGEQRLPDTQMNPDEFKRPAFSKPYTVVNIQYTYYIKKAEIYAGCENLFDFRQLQPILSWQNPFSPYFDTSSVWGPTRGREIYIGFRYKLNRD